LVREISPEWVLKEMFPPVFDCPGTEYEYALTPPLLRTILPPVEVRATLPPFPLSPVSK
jgi:hypothetical protein